MRFVTRFDLLVLLLALLVGAVSIGAAGQRAGFGNGEIGTFSSWMESGSTDADGASHGGSPDRLAIAPFVALASESETESSSPPDGRVTRLRRHPAPASQVGEGVRGLLGHDRVPLYERNCVYRL